MPYINHNTSFLTFSRRSLITSCLRNKSPSGPPEPGRIPDAAYPWAFSFWPARSGPLFALIFHVPKATDRLNKGRRTVYQGKRGFSHRGIPLCPHPPGCDPRPLIAGHEAEAISLLSFLRKLESTTLARRSFVEGLPAVYPPTADLFGGSFWRDPPSPLSVTPGLV
jgi:hypothetical protein